MPAHLPLVIAHRGASAYLPENTFEAFKLAFERFKSDMIEFDVQATRDGVPVIIHDARLERTTNGHGYVSQHSYSQLKHLDAGYYFDPQDNQKFPQRGKGIKIPTLEEVLKGFPKQSFAVEIKERSEELTHAVVGLLKKYGAADRAIVGSKHHLVSQVMKKHYPHLHRFCSIRNVFSLLLEYRRPKRRIRKDPMAVASTPTQFLKIRLDTVKWIEFLHAKEMKVFFWFFKGQDRIAVLKKRGADGFVVDDPGLTNRTLGRLPGIAPTTA